ncbi:hypothetical protein ACJX0J_035742 [Zea mays]
MLFPEITIFGLNGQAKKRLLHFYFAGLYYVFLKSMTKMTQVDRKSIDFVASKKVGSNMESVAACQDLGFVFFITIQDLVFVITIAILRLGRLVYYNIFILPHLYTKFHGQIHLTLPAIFCSAFFHFLVVNILLKDRAAYHVLFGQANEMASKMTYFIFLEFI